ncbi:MAG: hypothetical protein AB7I01_18000 [Gammaproteobacteria bacterium]
MREGTIGIAWLPRDGYRGFVLRLPDACRFPSRYDDWLAPARALRVTLEGAAHRVVRVHLELSELLGWCERNDLAADARGRGLYVLWFITGRHRELRRPWRACLQPGAEPCIAGHLVWACSTPTWPAALPADALAGLSPDCHAHVTPMPT